MLEAFVLIQVTSGYKALLLKTQMNMEHLFIRAELQEENLPLEQLEDWGSFSEFNFPDKYI